MRDWNHDGKVDLLDGFIQDEIESRNKLSEKCSGRVVTLLDFPGQIEKKDCALARFWTNRPAAAINRGQISAMKGLKKYNNYDHPQLYYETMERLIADDAVSLFL